MNLHTIAELLGQTCVSQSEITGVSIDSRLVQPGHLFIALPGNRVDGHQYIQQAQLNGAVAVVCTQLTPALTLPQFLVKDSLSALTTLALFHRNSIDCPIIALTGSNGKTTVKEMIHSILPKPAHATPGNLNNHIGVPLSLLQLTPKHRYAVFELGASHLGEIASTAALVRPDVALINNIAPAHIGEFGSIAAVADAKGEIYQALSAIGSAIVNEDDNYAHYWDKHLKNKQVFRFSARKPADFMADALTWDNKGHASFQLSCLTEKAMVNLQVPGFHNVQNALAAAASCHAIGIALADIVEGLNSFRGVAGRMTFLEGKNQAVVIDDSYNANLNSVLTAVDVLSKRPGRRILVLGDMGELGEWTQEHHKEIGKKAQQQGIDILMTCGIHSKHSADAFGNKAQHYQSQLELTQDLLLQLDNTTTVLVKGSRSAAMEKIVQQLLSI